MFTVSLGHEATLKPLLTEHAAELAACVQQHRAHLAPWTVLAARVTDVASARQLLETYADPPRYFAIRRNDQLIGGALFRSFAPGAGVCEVGGWLTPEAQGQGLITNAFRHLIEHAFDVHGMTRVELRASPHNHAALAIALRLGMTHETTLRQAFTLNGVIHDSEVWVLQP